MGLPECLKRFTGENFVVVFRQIFNMSGKFAGLDFKVKGRWTFCDHFSIIFKYIQCKKCYILAPVFLTQNKPFRKWHQILSAYLNVTCTPFNMFHYVL